MNNVFELRNSEIIMVSGGKGKAAKKGPVNIPTSGNFLTNNWLALSSLSLNIIIGGALVFIATRVWKINTWRVNVGAPGLLAHGYALRALATNAGLDYSTIIKSTTTTQ